MTGYQRGAPSKFNIRISAEKGKPFNMKIYRVRSFRFWKSIDKKGEDLINYSIVSENGSLIKEGEITGDVHGKMELIDIVSEKKQDYLVNIVFMNDSWGAVSCSNQKTFINLNRYFYFRMPPLGTGFASFFVKAPLSNNTIKIKFNWNKGADANMGSVAGVMLQDINGNSIYQKRWIVPIGTQFNIQGNPDTPTVSQIELPIPSEHKGKILKLNINAPKGVGWSVENLDNTWASNSFEAFK
ncbi:MAG: hypothetical protein A2017_10770 [Lentisphaerae bacterium GWF2_44_16]|nr:MAG: hypothetical protein A2017_10770 [Lentisphaerae bacterium GWF2_44_16]